MSLRYDRPNGKYHTYVQSDVCDVTDPQTQISHVFTVRYLPLMWQIQNANITPVRSQISLYDVADLNANIIPVRSQISPYDVADPNADIIPVRSQISLYDVADPNASITRVYIQRSVYGVAGTNANITRV